MAVYRYLGSLAVVGILVVVGLGTHSCSASKLPDWPVRQITQSSSISESKTRVSGYLHGDERDLGPFGDALQAAVGNEWSVTAEHTTSLKGWDGFIYGYTYRFSNESLKINGKPATFRFVAAHLFRSGWKSTTALPESERDALIGVTNSDYFVLCCPETYGTAYPDKWKSLVGQVCKVAAVHPSVGGAACVVLGGKEVFFPDEEIAVSARICNLSDSVMEVPQSGFPLEASRVMDSAGRELVPKGAAAPCLCYEHKLEPFASPQIGMPLTPRYDLSKPGSYTIRGSYRFGDGKDSVAESQEVIIRVVPKDMLQVMAEPNGRQSLASALLNVALLSNSGPNEQFSDVTICFGASHIATGDAQPEESCAQNSYEPYLNWTWYSAAVKLAVVNQQITMDLASLKWNESWSSKGPHCSFSDMAKSGAEWAIVPTLSGKLNGKIFAISGKPFKIKVGR